jgi:hypothetical protein
MAFTDARTDDPTQVGAGERYGTNQLILTARSFEDALVVGRFAKIDAGRLDNMDGSATPVIAGVVLRNVANPVEDDATIDSDLFSSVEYIRQGLVSVRVKSGETPSRFARVYVSNAGDANDGMATATATDVAVNAEFIEEIQTGVWLIYVNPAPGDIAAHTGDASGAHAASAIDIADAGGFTASTTVEAVTQEMLPAVSRIAVIADPGNAGAIPVLRSGNVALTSAGAETRTIAAPATVGITMDLTHDVDGGAIVITSATTINQTGNNTITLTEVADYIRLVSVRIGGAVVWRVAANDGAALSTV